MSRDIFEDNEKYSSARELGQLVINYKDAYGQLVGLKGKAVVTVDKKRQCKTKTRFHLVIYQRKTVLKCGLSIKTYRKKVSSKRIYQRRANISRQRRTLQRIPSNQFN